MPYIRDAHVADGRSVGHKCRGARNRSFMDRQLGHQRHVGALLAERGMDGTLASRRVPCLNLSNSSDFCPSCDLIAILNVVSIKRRRTFIRSQPQQGRLVLDSMQDTHPYSLISTLFLSCPKKRSTCERKFACIRPHGATAFVVLSYTVLFPKEGQVGVTRLAAAGSVTRDVVPKRRNCKLSWTA
jgi:hypothetical protein